MTTTTTETNGRSAKTDAGRILEIELAFILPSPTNPRRSFPKPAMDELAASIKERGVREPVTVRVCPKQADHFELVHGERRTRASKAAGLQTIPAILIQATDQEVLELQLLEHALHEDLSPLEEGEAYENLHKRFGVPVASIAKKIGRSGTYVYGRLNLCKLEPQGKKALLDGELTLDAAFVLSRVPAKLQAKAFKDLTEGRFPTEEGPITGDQARQDITGKYMLKLADAAFDRGDAELVKKAGACTTCPKRTGNQAELFADVKSPDLCTDPDCHKEKTDAWWEQQKAAGEAKGKKVLSDAEAKKVFSYGRVSHDAKYVDLKDHNYTDPKNRTWKEILGKAKPPVVLARDDTGKVHELVSKEEAGLALKKAGGAASAAAKTLTRERSGPDPATVKANREAAIRRASADRALELLVAAAAKKGPSVEVLRVIVLGLIVEVWADRVKAVVERRGLTPPKDAKRSAYAKPNHDVLTAAAKKMALPELTGLAVELVASRDAYSVHRRFDSDALAQACAELKVDWGKCQAEAKAERAEKDKAKKSKAATAKKAKRVK